jgi:hypothetical protein
MATAKVLVRSEEYDAGGVVIPNEALDRLREMCGRRGGFVTALPLLTRICQLEGDAKVKRQPHSISGNDRCCCSDYGPREIARAFKDLAECEIVYERHGDDYIAGWVLDFDEWPIPV